jgi:hypothetical protein
MLVLGLAVPVQARNLFPVREKIVEVPKTNYVVTAGACVITLVLSLIVFRPKLSEYQHDLAFKEGESCMFNDMNKYLCQHGLFFGFDDERNSWILTYFESLDHTEPNDAQRLVSDAYLDAFSRIMRDKMAAAAVAETAESTTTE